MMKQLGFLALLMSASTAFAQFPFAVEVVDFESGGGAATLNDPLAALGAPELITGERLGFPGSVSPFNPPFQSDEIVSIGPTGSITFRLSNFAVAGDGPELGFFVNNFLLDDDFDGVANDPAGIFDPDSAEVLVSEDGESFESLGVFLFDIPTNAFIDAENGILADPTQPFEGTLSDFSGLGTAEILDLLNGSAGGLFLDIEDSGLPRVGFVRLVTAPGEDTFEIDAISIASNAIGAPTVPEPSSLLLALGAFACNLRRRRQG